MKKYVFYILSLILAVSCLEEERSPEEILVPTPAQVECSDESLMLTSKVPSGSEKLVQECGFYYSKDKSMEDTRKVAGVLAGNNFTAELPDRTYGTTYYICSYVTNGHGSEIRSDLRSYTLDELDDYVEFGALDMLSYDKNSSTLEITIDAEIWGGVKITEIGVCYGDSPTGLDIDGPHKVGVWNRTQTKGDAGVVTISIDGLSDATQYYLRPYVKDGEYLSYGEVVPFYIPAVAKVSTFDAEAVTASGATLSGEVTDECGSAVTERGFVWIEGDAVPTIEDSHMAAGSGLGAMTATVEGLDPNKKYTFRAYATNASGTAYGEAKVFTTLVALPSLAASTISNITSTSATFNGVLANNGGESVSEVGFYYSTEKEVNPETAQKVSLEYSTYQKSAKELSANTLYSAMQSAQAAASDEGEAFSIDVFSLGIKTKYYVKSYAVNSAGVAYGSVVNFETAGEIATIKTVGSSEVTTSSAVLSANITTDNGEKITERGFVWMEGAGNPTTDSNKLKVSGEVGEYTATLEGLDPNKKYSFRAYAINAEGTAYGDVMNFTTEVALPEITSPVVSAVTSTSAKFSSTVRNHGGETVTEVGFYYSTDPDVNLETAKKVSLPYTDDAFSSEVSSLEVNTNFYVKSYAKNSAGTVYSEINSFKTESSVPSVKTISVTDITPESAVLTGSVPSDNGTTVTERGFVWIQGDGIPTIDSHKLTTSGTTGEFTLSLNGLESNKKYSFRAYATNSKGTAYGEIMTFSTVAGLPVLSSVDVSSITSTSATFASTVTDHGGETVSEVGFYYSTDENVDPATSVKINQKYAKDAFSTQITDLAIFTKYYVKAYATNSAGTAYSDVVEFKTLASTPVVNTVGSSDITFNSATLSGKVLTDNGAAITERGFVWIKGEGTPTTSSNKVKVDGTTGDFTASLKDLEPNVTYSFRAYAVNSVGVTYGDVMTFTTGTTTASLKTASISNITATTATFSSEVLSNGGAAVTEVGFFYSTDAAVDPSKSLKVNRNYTGDSFSISVTDLLINTKYYVKAYAVNSAGTVYSEVASFTTATSVPVVNTVGSKDVTSSTVTLSGNVVTDNGAAITERGFVWMQGDGTPTTSSNKLKVNGTTGEYTGYLSNLNPNATYSYCAYAINSNGTTYGAVLKFETVVGLPAVSSVEVSAITYNSASFSSTVTSHGGETASEVGFYYSLDANVDPTQAVKVSLKYSNDTFTTTANDLKANTKYYVKSYVVNSTGTVYSSIKSFTTLASTPAVNTIGSSDITSSSVVLSGVVLADNGSTITERGFVWTKGSETPTTSSNKLKVTGTLGEYTGTLSGLDPNQSYSFRAYAINELGTSYGAVMTFETVIGLPALGSVAISNITSTSASLQGTITSHGGEDVAEAGFYYSTDESLDPSNSIQVEIKSPGTTFSKSIEGLTPNTKYYVKSYAKNSIGTTYSAVTNFTTLASTPVVNTVGSSSITATSAVLSGTVVTDNGGTIQERGFVWLQGSGVPTIDSNKIKATGTTGDYTITLEGLEPNQTYSYRAYAYNSLGVAYGQTKTFTTSLAAPSLGTTSVSNVASRSATFNGVVASDGGETISEVGFYYSTSETVDPSSSQKVNIKYSDYQKSAKGYASSMMYSTNTVSTETTLDSGDIFSIDVFDLALKTRYYVKSYAVNSVGTSYGDVVNFMTQGEIPVVNTVAYSDVGTHSVTLSGKVVSDSGEKITERGFVWIEGDGNPTTSSNRLKVDGETGDYTASLTELSPNKKYTFRAYAINAEGTAYGELKGFTTKVALPTVSNAVIYSVTATSASFSAKVTNHGGETVSEVGFYYSTNAEVNPESAQKVNMPYSADSFSIDVAELLVNTKYYVRSYTKNSAGTSYGTIENFTTLASVPVVKTTGSSDVTESGALLSGTVVTDNGATITERGFVWLKGTDAPTTSSNKVKVEGATGDFTATISGLDPNQKYSFRAYAINSKGTAYGDIMTFNTIAGLPALSAMKVSSITTTSATFTCTVTNHGGETVSEVGFYYSKEENVDVETAQKISEGYSSDAFSLEAEGLEIGQNYYVKAYTKNSIGEVYSAVVPFKTTSSAPSVSTIGYTKLSATSAELSGEVTDDNGENIFERGFVWIKGTSTPTTSHNKLPAFADVGEYAVLFEGIEPNQVYSYRAYAINSIGTAYGDVMQLQINVSLPVVTTNDVTGITNTSATSGGVIYSDGGGEILSKGVVWSMRENPTVEFSNMTNDGEGNSAFASHITDLCQGLTYYVRAYATNIMGTVYGEEKQFTTTGEIQGTPLEASNSFIISAPGTYTFQTVKGNSTESVGSVASAEVLWESFGTDEKPGIGSVVSFAAYNNGKIGFAPSDRFREGNAVIAAKDASGTILWSWHIWLTDQPQEHIYPNNAGTMMDRNLGATSATPGDAGALGLLYQWGRKDPFLGGSSIDCFDVVAKSTIAWPEKENCTTATGTVAYAIEHPTTFITDSHDWCYTEGYSHHDYTRWKSDKTIYDPCPVGWRVPDGGESGVWNISGVYDDYTYDSSDKSMIFYISSPDVTCYPASGYRGYYGKLFGVGSEGYYWSVKPSIEEYDLSFQNANLFPPTDGLSLAEAHSVRCQKEGTGGGFKYDNNFSTSGAKSLSDAGTANSYIVSSAGTYSISAVKGNSSESIGSVASAEVLWETFGTDEKVFKGNLVSGARYQNGKIYFKTADPYREGNAVIAAKDASGTILWSWHIWFTDKPQEHIYPNGAGTMMDRNLGATSATPGDVGTLGLLYQWGRKDPFLNSSSIDNTDEAKSTITWPEPSSSYNATMEYVISNPTTFVSYNSSNEDWYYTGSNSVDDTRWQSEKTIYDPCPTGWRVPEGGVKGVWNVAGFSSTAYDNNNKGISFSITSPATTWYPSSGSRDLWDGALGSVGYYCNYWTVTPNGSHAYNFGFEFNGSVYPIRENGSRAYGFSVRCLKEGTGQEYSVPTVEITEVFPGTYGCPTSYAKIVDNGGAEVTQVGFRYGPDPELKASSTKVVVSENGEEFSSDLYYLSKNFYIQAFATNRIGTGYSEIYYHEGPPNYPAVETKDITNITATTAESGGINISTGEGEISDKGLVWDTEQDPTIDRFKASAGAGPEPFSIKMTDLNPGQTYYVRAYVQNEWSLEYGKQKEFTTKEAPEPAYNIPSVERPRVVCHEETGFVEALGTISDNGGSSIIDAGFRYATDPDLTSSSVTTISALYFDDSSIYSELAIGPGTYYIQAYATNLAGTGYSEIIKYVQDAKLPTVEITGVDQMGAGIADAYACVSNDGGDSILELGFIYDTTPDLNPATAKRVTVPYSGDVFWYSFYDLKPNTYYIQAYATTSAGTAYSDMMSFNILLDPNFTATDLASAGTANSYIVSSYGTYSFPAVKGNSFESVGSVATAEVLWESFGTSKKPSVGDLIDSVQYYEDKIVFSTNDSYKEGNAVIAAKDANGTILWSWHIWLTDQPASHRYPNSAGTMMDRNLGATSATPGDVEALGLLYQWGRKDPFLSGDSISSNTEAKSTINWPSAVSTDSSTGTIDYVTSHPTTYVTANSSTSYDWHCSARDNSLWQSQKTIYDPCPVGWRVPKGGLNGVWDYADFTTSGLTSSLFDETNRGISFSISSPSSTWYPASGIRPYNSYISDVGNMGGYWSATSNSAWSNSYYFGIYYDGVVDPLAHYDRAAGLSVRCQKE